MQQESINWYGTMCLAEREVKRFLSVYHQTVFTPVTSALIFLTIFTLAIGKSQPEISGIKFVDFVAYGLIIMSVAQNAFSNSSSSFIMSKVLGYIIDIFTPPLGSTEIIIAYTTGSVVRGVLIGISVSIAMAPFVHYNLLHPFWLVYFVLSACIFLGQLGLLAGIVSNSFDQIAAFTNYIITPLTFLSGTFYSVQNLHIFFQIMNYVNPFFYIVDGFRYCLTDHIDGNIAFGAIFLLVSNIGLYHLLTILLDKGWNTKQ